MRSRPELPTLSPPTRRSERPHLRQRLVPLSVSPVRLFLPHESLKYISDRSLNSEPIRRPCSSSQLGADQGIEALRVGLHVRRAVLQGNRHRTQPPSVPPGRLPPRPWRRLHASSPAQARDESAPSARRPHFAASLRPLSSPTHQHRGVSSQDRKSPEPLRRLPGRKHPSQSFVGWRTPRLAVRSRGGGPCTGEGTGVGCQVEDGVFEGAVGSGGGGVGEGSAEQGRAAGAE